MPRPRRWTDEQLAAAVAAGSTLGDVHRRLGLRAEKYDVMRAYIARLGLDATPVWWQQWSPPDHSPRCAGGSATDRAAVSID